MRLGPRHTVWPVILVVLVLGLLSLGRRSPFVPIRNAADRALSPVERGAAYLRTFGSLRAKNDELRLLATQLAIENFYLKEYRFENQRLRRLLGFLEETRFTLLPARVVTRAGGRTADTWKIDRGVDAGIVKGMAVINHRGLVGRIEQVLPTSASIRTLRNVDVRVSAVDQRSRVVGILGWEFPGGFRLLDVPASADVVPGDRIVSSGLGGVFPPGLPLGNVKEANASRGQVFQEVRVESNVDFSLLEEVYVVLAGEGPALPDIEAPTAALSELPPEAAPAGEGDR